MTRKVFVARHAEREDFTNPGYAWQAKNKYNTPLSENGNKQAKELAQQLKGKGLSAIYVSPFLRTIETANAVAEELDLPLRIEGGLAEWHNPAWQAHKPKLDDPKELKKRFPRIDLDYQSIRQPKYPETSDDVLFRAGQTARDLVARSEGNILMLGHGPSVIGASRGLTRNSPEILPQLSGLVELEGEGDNWKVANSGRLWAPKKNPPRCKRTKRDTHEDDAGTPGKPCGEGFISANFECHIGQATAALKPPRIDPSSLRKPTGPESAAIAVGVYAGLIAAGVIKDTIEDRQNYAQFTKDRAYWQENGIPKELAKAYNHESKDLSISLMAAEDRIKNNDYETLYVFDPQGKPIVIRKGETASARLSITDIFKSDRIINKGAIVTHNHPFAGGTFSPADLNVAGSWGLSEIRATTGREIYTLRPKNGGQFDPVKTAQLRREYEKEITPILNTAAKKFFKSEGTLKTIYYATFGGQDKRLVAKISKDIEFDIHHKLQSTISTKFKNDFEYKRVPRAIDERRELQFGLSGWANEFSDSVKPTKVPAVKSGRKTDSAEPVAQALATIQNLIRSNSGYAQARLRSVPKIAENGTVSGLFRDDKTLFRYNFSEAGVLSFSEAQPPKRDRADTHHSDRALNCQKGTRCGEACIERGQTCNLQLPMRQTRSLQQARMVLSESDMALVAVAAGSIIGAAAVGGVAAAGVGYSMEVQRRAGEDLQEAKREREQAEAALKKAQALNQPKPTTPSNKPLKRVAAAALEAGVNGAAGAAATGPTGAAIAGATAAGLAAVREVGKIGAERIREENPEPKPAKTSSKTKTLKSAEVVAEEPEQKPPTAPGKSRRRSTKNTTQKSDSYLLGLYFDSQLVR